MKASMYINSFGGVHKTGIYSPAGGTGWDPSQSGPDDIRRKQVLDKPYLSFGKLQLAEKLAFAAASLLFKGISEQNHERTGICIGSPYGSFSTDIAYMQSVISGFPSPAMFSATLPSSAVADIAIYYKCMGPNRVVSERGSSGLAALVLAAKALMHNKADSMIVLALNALAPRHREIPLLDRIPATENYAFALLCTAQNRSRTPCPKISLDIQYRHDSQAELSDELYFYTLISLLAADNCGEIDINTHSYTGHISLDKEI
ncbi:MAG: hypothetical protein GF350_07160 [Chitinivibrionales bacterium]|nr:hypothetical protein [Chitinivibrionales bacterium]